MNTAEQANEAFEAGRRDGEALMMLFSGGMSERGRELVRQHESYLDLAMEQFGELAHIGIQASLPASRDGTFVPREDESGISLRSDLDSINASYKDLPEKTKRAYQGVTGYLTAYIGRIVDSEVSITEGEFLEGRQAVYDGMVHGIYGNPNGMYELPADDPQAHSRYNETLRRLRAYDEMATPELQRADENILCLGFLALTRPQIFPWIDKRFWQGNIPLEVRWMYPWTANTPHGKYIQSEPGIREGAIRGLAAIKRVVRVKGPATPLQEVLLSNINATRIGVAS
ncbi:MAG TPA: hypothetical protein VK983_02165 [Candidatus Limnocylindrales bacterium]|nr:hypothetical protein [Candidatus Limnocylindrales bacterium]